MSPIRVLRLAAAIVECRINCAQNQPQPSCPQGQGATAINLRIGSGGLIDVSPAATNGRGRLQTSCRAVRHGKQQIHPTAGATQLTEIPSENL